MKSRSKKKSMDTSKAAAKDAPLSPYMSARREWNERYGSYIKQANNWRLAALGMAAVAVIAVSGLAVVASQHKVVPYIVETNTHGEAVSVRRANVAARPNTNQIKAALRQWIIGARTIYVDRRAQQVIVDGTYAMTLPESAAFQQLAMWHREQNPYQRSEREIVEITVNAVVPVSDETWQIEWTEVVRQRSGREVSNKQWQGTFTVTLAPPIDDQQIMVNPLGIYVRQFAWTTRL